MTVPSPSVENPGESSVFRATLRRERLAARAALSAAQRAELAIPISQGLERCLAGRSPGVLAFCSAVRGEFDAEPWVTLCIARGWRAAMPVVVAEAAPMRFYAWTPGSRMTRDRYGIPIPAETEVSSPDVLLLPLVAFDGDNYRLGYGGGYFDRTLATMSSRPLTIGIGYELGRVASIRPEAHDIPLDLIVTESGIFTGCAE